MIATSHASSCAWLNAVRCVPLYAARRFPLCAVRRVRLFAVHRARLYVAQRAPRCASAYGQPSVRKRTRSSARTHAKPHWCVIWNCPAAANAYAAACESANAHSSCPSTSNAKSRPSPCAAETSSASARRLFASSPPRASRGTACRHDWAFTSPGPSRRPRARRPQRSRRQRPW